MVVDLGEIGAEGPGLAAILANLLGDLFHLRRGTGGESDARAHLSDELGGGFADPAAGARDEHHVVFE